jgi:pilus assembly protein Flp/PilA
MHRETAMTRFRSVLVRRFRGFIKDRRGATAIEYALMASGIALVIVAAVALISERVRALYETIAAALA